MAQQREKRRLEREERRKQRESETNQADADRQKAREERRKKRDPGTMLCLTFNYFTRHPRDHSTKTYSELNPTFASGSSVDE